MSPSKPVASPSERWSN